MIAPSGACASRSDERGHRQPSRPARQPARPPCADREREGQDDRHARDHPVPELDVRVVALLREGLARLASRPVLAAEPRARQPDDGAGRDDQPQSSERQEREPPERGRRKLVCAQPRQARGLDVHAVECSRPSVDVDADAGFHVTDPAREQTARIPLGLESDAAVGRQRHEQAAGGLGIPAQRNELVGDRGAALQAEWDARGLLGAGSVTWKPASRRLTGDGWSLSSRVLAGRACTSGGGRARPAARPASLGVGRGSRCNPQRAGPQPPSVGTIDRFLRSYIEFGNRMVASVTIILTLALTARGGRAGCRAGAMRWPRSSEQLAGAAGRDHRLCAPQSSTE